MDMLLFYKSMKSKISFFNLNKKAETGRTNEQNKSQTLIQAGRQQFKKLQELGLKIPIALV